MTETTSEKLQSRSASQHDEALRAIKHGFFTFRNGIVADTLRKAGIPHRTIFGLQLPQLGEIARPLGKDTALARTLWGETDNRESRLLACWLFNPEEVNMDEAFALASSARSREECDILAFRLLRYLPFASDLASRLRDNGPDTAYAAEALIRNLDT